MKDAKGNIVNTFHKDINSLLDSLGLSYMHMKSDITNSDVEIVIGQIKDSYIQNWFSDLDNSAKLQYYRSFKSYFEHEKYLDCVNNNNYRITMTRLRCSSHHLLIEEGRYNNILRENKICKMCNWNVIENEYHFILICPLYRQLRINLLPN